MAERFPYERNQWAEFRKGTKLIPRYLLEDLVAALIKDPRTRQLQLLKGTELLESAEAAARARSVAATEVPTGTALELQLRLDDARKGEIAAKDALLGTTRLVYMLLEMVSSLHQRCTTLEQERDRARAAHQVAGIQAVQEELNSTQALLGQANDRLDQARRERQTAEELRLLAEQQAAVYRRALEDMSRPATSSTAARPSGATPAEGAADPWSRADRPPLWEYEAALETADDELAAHQSQMAAAREQMGVARVSAGQETSPTAVVGEVVRDVRADTADSPRRRNPESSSLSRFWGNLPPRNPNFTGRADLLKLLHVHLRQDTVLPVVVHGMGGAGKSQLAIEYAYRYQGDYDVVWWIPAERPALINQAMEELAQRLGLTTSMEAGIDVRGVQEALGRRHPYDRWLLIFDNADGPDRIRPFFPYRGGAIIVTSRDKEWSRVGSPVEVGQFTRKESTDLLLHSGQPLHADEAAALAEALGDLPLALKQAASWLAETGVPVSEYLRLLEHTRPTLREANPPHYPWPIAAAWNVTLEHLGSRSPAALRLLQLCSYFGADPIPRSLFSGLGNNHIDDDLDPALKDPLRLGRALREVNRYSLARIDHRKNTIQMHRLVQLVLRDNMPPDEQSRMRGGAHLLLAAADPGRPGEPMTWPRYTELFSHVVATEAVKSDQPRVRQLVRNIAEYLYHWGDHELSLEFSEQAWETWLVFGEEDQQALLMGQWLGFAYWAVGRFDDASRLAARLREISERTASEDGDDTRAAMLGVLQLEAAVRRAEGAFAASADLDRIAYERARTDFGDDAPATLDLAHSVAVSLRLEGEFRKAQELDRGTLNMKGRLFGEEDPRYLITKCDLALDIRECGDYAGARRLHEVAYITYRDTLGLDHPATIEALRQLSESCRQEGDHARSLELATDAHAHFIRRYQQDHPRIPPAELTLALALRHNGDLEAAHTRGSKACERFRQVYNGRHPHVLSADVDLAVTLRLLGTAEEAHRLDEAALTILSESLGESHPLTLVCAINLASDLAVLGRAEEARHRGEATLDLCRTAFGVSHPTTLACAGNLALDFIATGAETEGRALRATTRTLLERALDAQRLPHAAGTPHPAAVQFSEGQRANCDIDPQPL
ncbi:FxSxx-COOH system tetratricopeptide repeat protein [Streptomyces mirabilis]|uniref:FxSxx-COOH system tetratricopeptide repeat protein n=1 Tax=Streptomyces mirabilis TaxID=68239 RepID=UPI0015A67455|nr:FxSxx-COOH system tetratricopeptide repeat protein [Streptomyces mirabilis]